MEKKTILRNIRFALDFKHQCRKILFYLFESGKNGIFEYESFVANVEQLRRNLLKSSAGVIHIGASTGQERFFYSESNLNVIWVESIPSVFAELVSNIATFEGQAARNLLLGSIEGEVDFYLTSNHFMSSSIYQIDNTYPQAKKLSEVGKISLKMFRFDTVFQPEEIRGHDYWIIDVQGAELDVLIGMGERLDLCRILEVECSTFPLYIDAPLYSEIVMFLEAKGFQELITPPLNYHGNSIFINTNRN
jgi:FkbM family methyltransferase